jgi:hypothetical protein
MDEIANVERESEEPENEKNNEDGPEHRNSFGCVSNSSFPNDHLRLRGARFRMEKSRKS